MADKAKKKERGRPHNNIVYMSPAARRPTTQGCGTSWDMWRAVLKAAAAEPMSDREKAAFGAVAAREPPAQPVKELVCVAGRGAGKDSIAGLIATCAAINSSDRRWRNRQNDRYGNAKRLDMAGVSRLLPPRHCLSSHRRAQFLSIR
jgi:hypothetical protein